MWRFPSFALKKQVKFQEVEHCWLLPTTCPPTKLKPKMVCCQEGEDDEDMTPSDTTIAYKMRLLLFFHSDFWHNSLGSTCTCHYLLVGTIHTWEPGPCWRMSQTCGEDFKDGQGRPSPWPPP